MTSIQIITSYSLHQAPAVRNRMLSTIKSYLTLGCAVELFSSDHEFKMVDYGDFSGSENFSHISVAAVGSVHKSFFIRAVSEILSSFKLYLAARRSTCDIRIVTMPSMFLIIVISLLSRSSVMVADIRDLTWEYLPVKSYVGKFVKAIITCFINRGLKSADIITVTNQAELSYVKKLALQTPVFHLNNGISLNIFEELALLRPKPREHEIQVSYVGTVGIAQNLITLVNAAKLLPEVKFKVVGYGIELASLQNECNQMGLTNLEFYGATNWIDLVKVYAETDVLYANISANFSTAVPSKIFEYVSTGRHIIFGCIGVSRDILSIFEGVDVIAPDDVGQLVRAIKDYGDSGPENFASENRSEIYKNFIRERASDSVALEVIKSASRLGK